MDSWIRKFNRAEEHLVEINHLIGPGVGMRQSHPVNERFETYYGIRQWVYRLDLEAEFDAKFDAQQLAVIAGEFVFNVMSGLDHRAVSLVPADKKHDAGFPIFSDDPLAFDPNGRRGSHLNAKAWQKWKGKIKPFPASAAAALTDLQPFKAAQQGARPAQCHALKILRVLHDADEHKELFVADRLLTQVDVIVNGQIHRSLPSAAKDSTVIYASPSKVEVKVIGAHGVGLGVGAEGRDEWRWPLPRTFNIILNHIAEEVLPALKGLLVYPP